jgi:hypothetical protein
MNDHLSCHCLARKYTRLLEPARASTTVELTDEVAITLERLQEFLAGAWRECGYVHLIKDADSVSPEEAQAIDDGSEIFINSRSRLLAELAVRPLQPLSPARRNFRTSRQNP